MERVIIMGGGVAGLSAAQELAERGFEVTVVEHGGIAGGKARSFGKPGTGIDGRRDLPGEHGFRFFPGFYKHLPHAMARIPFGRGSVVDNLVPASRIMLAREGATEQFLLARFPRNFSDLYAAFRAAFTYDLGIPDKELAHFTRRLLVLLTSCKARRFAQWEKVSWWDFIGASERSDAYARYLARGLTQTLVAMQPQLGSARTVGYVMLQLIFDIATPRTQTADRVLNGPSNETWIDPWVAHLEALGVQFRMETRVEAINLGGGRIHSITVHDGGTHELAGDHFISAVPVEVIADLASPQMIDQDPGLAGLRHLADECVEWMNGILFYLDQDVPIIHGHTIYIDSPWALTSISQPQFWSRYAPENHGDGLSRGVLSVDISDWHTLGPMVGKPARECSPDEIRAEVWSQLQNHLNDTQHTLPDTYRDWFLDPAITFDPTSGLNHNAEPLLINKIDTWRLRPEATSRIPNLFLASDYVRTHTDLATMEAANEAARRAVNGILRATRSLKCRCRLWAFDEPAFFWPGRALDRARWSMGLPNLHDS